MSDEIRVKFQGMIPKGKRRQLEVEWRQSKDPSLLTWNDVVDYCAEQGLKALAEKNQSEGGLYAAHLYHLKRQKEADEAIRRVEWEVQGYEPRDYTQGQVIPFKRVEDG